MTVPGNRKKWSLCLFGILGMGRLRAQKGMQVEIGAYESRIGRVVIHRGLVLGPSLIQDTKIC